MRLIILASGNSSRFKEHDYKQSKYMLPFFGKSVIDHLASIDDIDIITIVYNKADGCDKDLQLKYRAQLSKKEIHLEFIDQHKDGPVITLNEVIKTIDDHEPYAILHIVTMYARNTVAEFLKISNLTSDNCVDGAVLTYSGFHPHHVFPENIYGYLKVDNDDYVIDYQENPHLPKSEKMSPVLLGCIFLRTENFLRNSLLKLLATGMSTWSTMSFISACFTNHF